MRSEKAWFVGATIFLFLSVGAPVVWPLAAPPASQAADAPRAGWHDAVRRDLAHREYELSWQAAPVVEEIEASWHAPNRAQGFRTYFTSEGIRVVPRTGSTLSWRWGLSLVGYGRGGMTQVVPQANLSASAHRIDYRRGALDERYENTPAGLEQIFMLPEPPEEGNVDEAIHLDLALWGDLSPRISEDGQAIDFVSPSGAPVLRYAQLKVTDARGEILPAWMEGLTGEGVRGIRLAIDAREAVYPLTVDPLATSAAWTAEGNQAGAQFGWTLGTAGDVNGDGYSDVIVGAPRYDNGQADEGRAFVYYGSASGLSLTPGWMAESDQGGATFGTEVSTAGDIDGDGYADVIVGAPTYDNGQTDEGRAFVYHGSASGPSPTPDWTAESDQDVAWLGRSVGTAGDVNGDGYADVIVGAHVFDGPTVDEGRAFVYHGSASGLSATPDWTADANQDNARFGISVDTAGDVNGDGYSDVIVGAYQFDNGQTDEGRAFVYHGSASGLSPTPNWTAESNLASAELGRSVGTAGDVNGDGYADVVVGAPSFTNGQTVEGRAFLYRGSVTGLLATPNWTAESNQAFALFGFAVGTAGDVNGDGYADVIIGSHRFANGQTGEGRAFVYLGSIGSLASSWTAESEQVDAELGFAVGTAGDVNGDGYADVIVGAPGFDNPEIGEGRALVYHGSATALVPELSLQSTLSVDVPQPSASSGSSVSTAGDVNGDGYADVIVGAPGDENGQADEGRAYLYLGPDVGPGGSGPAWTGESNQASAGFGTSVATAGDVNGDGHADVIVGAPFFANGQTGEGRAYLYLGSTSGLATTAAWTVDSDQAGANLGASVAAAGDVNGDGYADVIVGAPYYDNGATDEGRAYLYLGSASGLATSPAWVAESDQAGARFGTSAATAGDVNRDGYSDVIVGAPYYDNGATDEGRAYLYVGSAAGLATSPAWTAEDHIGEFDEANAHFGSSVATAGDVNGDGFSDVIVGAPGSESGPGAAGGRAYLHLGSASGLAASSAWRADPAQHFAEFGRSVASAGDVNGDGYSDVVVGAPHYDDSFVFEEGRAYVYLGSASGLATDAAWTSGSYQFSTESRVGASVAPAGDVDGDGYADFLVGAPGWDYDQPDQGGAFFYTGTGAGRIADRIPRQARTDATAPIGLLGKSDSEAAFDLKERGRTAAGRGKVSLQWEVKPLGTAFNGTGIGTSPAQDTGAPNPPSYYGSATELTQSITGLAEGTFYHWRLRTASSDPYFPRSPWISVRGNNVTETKLRTAGCLDGDGDGYGAVGDPSCSSLTPDCDDQSASAWGTPGETLNLGFTSGTTLAWDPPLDPGALVSTLLYDTLRSTSGSGFLSASCLESDDGPNTVATDGTAPVAGQVFFYLTRAQTACALGGGTLGTSSSGAPRAGVACP